MLHVPASDLLLDLRNREGGDELTVGEIADATGGRIPDLVGMLLAVVLAVPIPGLNIAAAFGTVGLGIGIIQRDGKLIVLAVAAAAVTSVGTAAVLSGLWALVRGAAATHGHGMGALEAVDRSGDLNVY